jgi:hypothetical protein
MPLHLSNFRGDTHARKAASLGWFGGSGCLEVGDQRSGARFRSVKGVCRALRRENVLVVFCENQLVGGTYEDLLRAAKKVSSRARIVLS